MIYLDEQLPPVEKWVLLLIVQVNHRQTTGNKLQMYYDWGRRFEDGTWITETDWDEGTWAIVGWLPMPKYPSEEEIRKHKTNCHIVGD